MADNTAITPGAGETIRDKDRAGVKTQIVGLDLNIGGSETLMSGSVPVTVNAGTAQIGTVGSAPSATGTITSPALSLTSFTALAANTARKTATFYNDSANVVYLALAATASTTAHTVQLQAGQYYELPGTNTVFTGLVSAIALVATGSLRVTELS